MRWFAMALLAVSVAACGSDTPSDPTPVAVVGTWTLETVNGARLPVVLNQSGNDKVELISASIDLMAGGTFSSTSNERSTIGGVSQNQSYVDPGHFAVVGAVVTLTFGEDASVSRGTVAGDAMTFDAGGVLAIYRRSK